MTTPPTPPTPTPRPWPWPDACPACGSASFVYQRSIKERFSEPMARALFDQGLHINARCANCNAAIQTEET